MLRHRRRPLKPVVRAPLVVQAWRRERQAYLADHAGPDAGNAVIASYNIHKCIGLDGRFDPARILAVIKEIDADVLALQEVDRRFGARAGLLDLQALERETGFVPVPLLGTRSSHGWHGNLVLVRGGTAGAARRLVLPGAEPRGAVVVDVGLAAGPVRIIAAHLGLLRRSRARQVEAILSAATAGDGRPALLIGDLNEWRLGKRSSLRALAPAFGPLHAAVASFPARFPVWPLDRILASPHSLVCRIEVHDSALARVASDHLPIKAAIRLGEARPAVAELASAA